MQQQDIDKLTTLRQTILDNLVPLMDSNSLEPMDRFRLLSRLAQAQGKPEFYEKAFEAASRLEGDDKLQSYMSLLDDVDYEIDTAVSSTEGAPQTQPTPQPQPAPQPAQQDNFQQ
ncbi:MAG TPA: hypothetical protein VFS14_01200 [Candidatus Saccharimonadales bacterium]|nr:hypothetical protein [Candidatus Saccharimonadales bacterium]